MCLDVIIFKSLLNFGEQLHKNGVVTPDQGLSESEVSVREEGLSPVPSGVQHWDNRHLLATYQKLVHVPFTYFLLALRAKHHDTRLWYPPAHCTGFTCEHNNRLRIVNRAAAMLSLSSVTKITLTKLWQLLQFRCQKQFCNIEISTESKVCKEKWKKRRNTDK